MSRRLKFAPNFAVKLTCVRTISSEPSSPITSFPPITPTTSYPSFPSFSATPLLKGKIWLGSYEDAKHLPPSIPRVLNVAEECSPILKDGVQVKWIKLIDHSDQPIVDAFSDAFSFIHDGVSRNEPVFIHCQRGVSRSATFVIAYLIAFHQKSINNVVIDKDSTSTPLFQQAFGYVKARREFVSPNFGFCETLNVFSKSFGSGFVLK